MNLNDPIEARAANTMNTLENQKFGPFSRISKISITKKQKYSTKDRTWVFNYDRGFDFSDIDDFDLLKYIWTKAIEVSDKQIFFNYMKENNIPIIGNLSGCVGDLGWVTFQVNDKGFNYLVEAKVYEIGSTYGLHFDDATKKISSYSQLKKI